MSENVQHPKVVVIGAGSLFFGRQAVWQMVHSPILNQGTLALVDTNAERLDAISTLAEKVIAYNDVPLKLETTSDWKDVLPGADFVVLSFAEDTVRYRGIDCILSEKYGIRMCSGDTIGPGGIFRAMREFPVILDAVKDIEAMCPNAWTINYINPSTVHGIGLMRYAPQLKSFALCDSLHMPHVKMLNAGRAGIISSKEEYTEQIDADFDMRIAGVNHFTFMLKAAYRGKDVMPKIAESIREVAAKEADGGDTGAKALLNNTIGFLLYEAFGAVPVCVGHTKEYVPYFQGITQGITGIQEPVPQLSIWETEDRYERHEAMWNQVDAFNTGAIPIEDYTTMLGPDHATDIIENMVGGLGKPFYVNTTNRGAVTNMADDAFLELLCDIDMNGPVPRAVGEMPRGLRGMQEVVLDTHELTAEAVATCDLALLRRAMLTDPLVNSIGVADKLIAELLDAERDMIPDCWY